MNRLRLACLGFLAATLLGACAGPAKNTAGEKADKDSGEYVYYTPTGSSIPVKVRKEQVQSSDSQTTQDQNMMRDLQLRGSRAVKDH